MPESAPTSESVAKPFASSGDLREKVATLDEVADGVYAYTAEGDPNVGAIIGPESIVVVDSRARLLATSSPSGVLRTGSPSTDACPACSRSPRRFPA